MRVIAKYLKFLSTLKCRKRYAILINTWKRYDLLKQSIFHYSTCLGVESIHIVWSEPEPPSESLVTFLRQRAKENSRRHGRELEDELRFEINEEDSLNNRFKEIKGLKTEAIFSVDDDVIFPCSTVEFAFSVWQSAPETMVGFVPRMHWPDHSVCCFYFHLCACSSSSLGATFLFSYCLIITPFKHFSLVLALFDLLQDFDTRLEIWCQKLYFLNTIYILFSISNRGQGDLNFRFQKE